MLLVLFLLIPSLHINSLEFDDLTNDYTATIDFTGSHRKDNTSDRTDATDDKNKKEDQTGDRNSKTFFGNYWYSRQNIYFMHSTEMGVSGTKDFIEENFLFKYRFRSKNRNAFAIRLFHYGFAPGVFSSNFTFFNFAVLGGFEYLYKIFGPTSGLFAWADIGGTNKNFAINIGIGLGDRNRDGVEFNILYMHNLGIQSRLDFYFLFWDVFTLRGKLGIDVKFTDGMEDIDIFTLLNGLYLGFFINHVFRLEFGGGFTVNQYGFFSGFGGADLIINIF